MKRLISGLLLGFVLASIVSAPLVIGGGIIPSNGNSSGSGGASTVSPRMATLVFAASDSNSKAGADYILTGTADQTTLNTAIAAATAGSQLFFRRGTYVLTDEVDITTARLTLTGENNPYFATWGGGYPATDTLGSGAIFKQTVSGKNGIVINAGMNRTVLEKLYLVAQSGASYLFTGYGVLMGAGPDKCTIEGCAIYGWANGIYVNSDTCRVVGNDINSIATYGIYVQTNDSFIDNNVVYSCNFANIAVAGPCATVTRNQVAQMGPAAGIVANTALNCIIAENNLFISLNAATVGIGIVGGSHGTIVSNNQIHMSNDNAGNIVGTGNTSGDAIQIGGTVNGNYSASAANNCTIAHNHIDNAGSATSTGYAVDIVTGTGNQVFGNNVTGSKFRSAGATTINAGSGNFVSGNIGDNQNFYAGTGTNDSAGTGNIGEIVTSTCPSAATTATVTITIASPAVISWTSHGFNRAAPVRFTTTGALPTGITASTTYYVVPIDANSFSIATTVDNAISSTKVNTSGSQSGTQTGTAGVGYGGAGALTTGTVANITGISLTAGDWDVEGIINLAETSATVTARAGGINTVSATIPTDGSEANLGIQTTTTTETNAITLPRKRVSISATSTVYLPVKFTFSAGTAVCYGAITARRVR